MIIMVKVNFDLPESVHIRFKVYAAKNKCTLPRALEKLLDTIEEMVSNQNTTMKEDSNV